MRIIAHRTLAEFWKKHVDATVALQNWYHISKSEEWTNLQEIRNTFSNVDYVGNQRYVFNIKGNHYRLVAKILFSQKIMYIRFIGTHEEYERIDCSTI